MFFFSARLIKLLEEIMGESENKVDFGNCLSLLIMILSRLFLFAHVFFVNFTTVVPHFYGD